LKNVTIIVVVPFDLYWAAEIEVQCNNFRKFGYSSSMHVLVHEEELNPYREYWNRLQERYSEVKFFFYRDENLKNLKVIYQPVIRPNCLKQHWKAFPELEQQAILYIDSDVLFTKRFDFSSYLNDDVCYLSKTPYIDADYFASKRKDVLFFRLDKYDQRDVLQELTNIVGIDKQVVIDNKDCTGGCQYLLKNIDYTFWEDLERNCIELRMHSLNINAEFFASENKGLQSWAIGDMCGLLWNLWKRGKTTSCPDDMDFVWSTTPIDKYDSCIFYHNAGVSSKMMELNEQTHKMFYKSDIRFRTSTVTFFDMVYNNISTDYCSCMYVKAIEEVENPICKTEINEY
jgi:hypothetical protein